MIFILALIKGVFLCVNVRNCVCIMLCDVVIGEDAIKIPGVNPTFWLNHIFFTNPMQFDAGVSSETRTIYINVYTVNNNYA